MFTYKLTLAYDGTHYQGWQIQSNAHSIQQTVQDGLKVLLGGETVSAVGSGRTDAGVHAAGQVAHFKTPRLFAPNRLCLALNGQLPKDIRIKKVEIASPTFHAQYDAIGKEYHYHLYLKPVMDPFRRHYCWHLFRKIEGDLLREAALLFVGTHDFSSFTHTARSGSAAKNPIRTLYRLDIFQTSDGFRLEFEGNGFLYKMVRNLVTGLVDVASHRCSIEEMRDILERKDRRRVGCTAPPQGLFLMRVDY